MKSNPKDMPIPPRATLSDLARKLGLSPSTVSLALNGRGREVRLSESTLQRIQEAADSMGYRPNYRARALASQRSHLIAFASAQAVPMITGVNQQIIQGAVMGLQRRGYYPVIVPLLGEPQSWSEVLSPDRMDGALMASPMPKNVMELYRVSGLPMVASNVLSDLPITHIIPDEFHNARLATQHLIHAGHRRIVYVYPSVRPTHHFSVEMRQEGYESVMKEAGLACLSMPMNLHDAKEVLAGLSTQPQQFTAAVIYDHNLAFDFLVIALHENIALPQRLSIVTFNTQALTEVSYLPLSTITTPGLDLGELAAAHIIKLVETPKSQRQTSKDIIRLPGELRTAKSVIPAT